MEVFHLAVDYGKSLYSCAPSGKFYPGGFLSTEKHSTEGTKFEDNGLRSKTGRETAENGNNVFCEQ